MSDGENDEDDSGFNEGTGTNNLRSKSVNRLDRQVANAQRICPPQGGVFVVPCNRELDRHHVGICLSPTKQHVRADVGV